MHMVGGHTTGTRTDCKDEGDQSLFSGEKQPLKQSLSIKEVFPLETFIAYH